VEIPTFKKQNPNKFQFPKIKCARGRIPASWRVIPNINRSAMVIENWNLIFI
jgi:hypothetical protein